MSKFFDIVDEDLAYELDQEAADAEDWERYVAEAEQDEDDAAVADESTAETIAQTDEAPGRPQAQDDELQEQSESDQIPYSELLKNRKRKQQREKRKNERILSLLASAPPADLDLKPVDNMGTKEETNEEYLLNHPNEVLALDGISCVRGDTCQAVAMPLSTSAEDLPATLAIVNFACEVSNCYLASLQAIPLSAGQDEEGHNEDDPALAAFVEQQRGLRYFAATKYEGKIIIQGGQSASGQESSSIVTFDTQTFEWQVLRSSTPSKKEERQLAMSGHHLIQVSNQLLLFNGGNSIFQFTIVPGTDKYTVSTLPMMPIAGPQTTRMPVLHYSSMAEIGGIYFFFGGIYFTKKDPSKMNVSNTLYAVEFNKDAAKFDNAEKKIYVTNRRYYSGFSTTSTHQSRNWNEIHRPCARYKGGSASLVTNRDNSAFSYVLVFGGIDENGRYLNDMHVFCINDFLWKEIRSEGPSPPPMHSFAMFTCPRTGHIFVHGGIKKAEDGITDVCSNTIYRFEPSSNLKNCSGKWTVVGVCGISTPVAASPSTYQMCSFGHKVVELGTNTAMAIGADMEQQGELFSFVMHGMDDKGQEAELPQWLWQCAQKGTETDVAIRTIGQDGSGDYLRAHRCILAARSAKFAELLQRLEDLNPRLEHGSYMLSKDDVPILEITEYPTNVVHAYVQFLYTAKIEASTPALVQGVLKMARVFGQAHILEPICTGSSSYLDSHERALSELRDDYLRLLEENPLFSDARIRPAVAQQTEDVTPGAPADSLEAEMARLELEAQAEASTFAAHRVFLYRSANLAGCLRSGMLEAETGTITLEDISTDGIHAILHYLYTDSLCLTDLSLCMELYIASKLLELPCLHQFCRETIREFLHEDNVLSTIQIAGERYQDESLLEVGLHYVDQMNLYDSIMTSEEFQHLSSDIKHRIKGMQLQKQKLLLKLKEQQAASALRKTKKQEELAKKQYAKDAAANGSKNGIRY